MNQLLSPLAFDEDPDPAPTLNQVNNILAGLPVEVGHSLRERINDVLKAYAPGPFSDALGDLEAYLTALDDTRLMPFENQIALKAYVMAGWKEWRDSFNSLKIL